MSSPLLGTIGVLPPGALGVAFGWHLTRGFADGPDRCWFLERHGSGRRQNSVLIVESGGLRRLAGTDWVRGSLPEAFSRGSLPEVVLVCTNPDQLLDVLSDGVALLEAAHACGVLSAMPIPALVLCSNGIYFARIRQLFVEKLEEATLFGRLPDLWPALMPQIIGRLVRGVTIQTGSREGEGDEARYQPGPRGQTRLAGGDPLLRSRIAALGNELGGWFADCDSQVPTRIEFDKALANLGGNVLGLLAAIGDDGSFVPLTSRQLFTAERAPVIRELVRHVLAVGQAVRAYGPEDSEASLTREVFELMAPHATHVPSSLQWVALQLRQGRLEPRLTPTERWLLDPLERFARSAGLDSEAAWFAGLRRELEHKLALAAARKS